MFDTFPNIIAFAVMGILLLVGTILRAQIPLFRFALVPASLLGGAVGLITFSVFDVPAVENMNFAAFTFHFFTLSFISLCLTRGSKAEPGQSGVLQGGGWLSLVWTFSIILQAFIGLTVIFLYNMLTGSTVDELLGVIATHGFTQGPGQALTIGNVWEQIYNIENAATIGLIYASLGFIMSFAIGVPVARWAVKKGLHANKTAVLDAEFSRGIFNQTTNVSTGRHITNPANVDTLAFHIAILCVVYLLTHIWLTIMQGYVGDAEPFGIRINIAFSHNLFFIHGLVIAVIIRNFLNMAGWGHFIDDDTQKRITGASVDFMMIGTLLSIQVAVLAELLAPIIIVTIAITLVTATMCFKLGNHLGNLRIERAITSFGTCTGSTGSALLLLRIVDPDFSTSVSKELAFFNVAVSIGTFHIWGVFAPVLPSLNPALAFAVYLGTIAIAGVLYIQLRSSRSQQTTPALSEG